METCVAVRPDGSRCRVVTALNPASHLCLFHDPERVERAQEVRSRGGKANAAPVLRETPPPPTDLDGIIQWTSWVATEVARGSLDPRQGAEVSRALGQMRFALEKRDLQHRIRELEATLRRYERERTSARA